MDELIFLSKIKREANIDGDTRFDDLVINLINELMTELVSREQPSEMLVSAVIAIASSTDLALPDNFLKQFRVKYKADGTVGTWLLSDRRGQSLTLPKDFAHPATYELIATNKIRINPIVANNGDIYLDYFRKPTPFVGTTGITADIPQTMEASILREVVARIHIYHDRVEAAKAMKGLGMEGRQSFQMANKENDMTP